MILDIQYRIRCLSVRRRLERSVSLTQVTDMWQSFKLLDVLSCMVHVYVCVSKNGVAMLSRHCAPSLFVFLCKFAQRSVYIGGLATIIFVCRHCLIVCSTIANWIGTFLISLAAPTLTFNLHSNQAQCTMRNSLFIKYLSFATYPMSFWARNSVSSRATRFFADAHLSTRFNQIHTSNAYVFEQINVFNDFYQSKITQSMRINESSWTAIIVIDTCRRHVATNESPSHGT